MKHDDDFIDFLAFQEIVGNDPGSSGSDGCGCCCMFLIAICAIAAIFSFF